VTTTPIFVSPFIAIGVIETCTGSERVPLERLSSPGQAPVRDRSSSASNAARSRGAIWSRRGVPRTAVRGRPRISANAALANRTVPDVERVRAPSRIFSTRTRYG
jgi:hypothetical protein